MEITTAFRFWDWIKGEWTVINYGIISIEGHPIFQFIKDCEKSPIEITHSIGETDINGKRIFVGDWVETTSDYEKDLYLILNDGEKIFARRFIIDYRCQCEQCIDEDKVSNCWTYEDLDIYYALMNPKIVGNQFEHPNLHKGVRD